MHLLTLQIENFKNYEKASLGFSEGINCFVGFNGAGKTNLLDAVYYLCTGKSYFNAIDLQLVRDEENYFSLRGAFDKEGKQEEVMCVLLKGKKKVIKRNDVPYTRMVEHYGEFPAVMIAPGDMELISGGSEERRKWLDGTISLEDREYLYYLMRYEKALQQRNAELRKMDEQPDRQLLQVYDQMLVPLAEQIHARRKLFIEEFLPYFERFHQYIAEGQEKVRLQYESSLHTQGLTELLESNFRKDLALQRTTSGIHRDDIEFYIGGNSLKRFGSQGQQKTFLLALKLAQHQYIKEKKGFAPLLLLDDVCERLDEKRLSLLFRLIQNGGFGQVFVTDSSRARITNLLQGFAEYRIFEIEKGKVRQDDED